jgi:hypothetical protein
MKPTIWGPWLWSLLHAWGERVDHVVGRNRDLQMRISHQLPDMRLLILCQVCQESFLPLLKRSFPPLGSKHFFRLTFIRLHNLVNKKLGKAQWLESKVPNVLSALQWQQAFLVVALFVSWTPSRTKRDLTMRPALTADEQMVFNFLLFWVQHDSDMKHFSHWFKRKASKLTWVKLYDSLHNINRQLGSKVSVKKMLKEGYAEGRKTKTK